MAKVKITGEPFVINGVRQVITHTFDTDTWVEELASMTKRLQKLDDKLCNMADKDFTYSDELYSDLFKDVNGFRPRGQLWEQWCNKTPTQKQKEWDALVKQL
jgi:hypothetical protein